MDGLLEVIFEGVPACNVGPFVFKLVRDVVNVNDITRDGDESLSTHSALDINIWEKLASSDDDVTILLNLAQLAIGSKVIKRATLQIIHYGNTNDLVILLSTADCKEGGLIYSEDIYQWAEELAKLFDVDNFIGGLEPAADEQTQIFSASGAGPIVKL